MMSKYVKELIIAICAIIVLSFIIGTVFQASAEVTTITYNLVADLEGGGVVTGSFSYTLGVPPVKSQGTDYGEWNVSFNISVVDWGSETIEITSSDGCVDCSYYFQDASFLLQGIFLSNNTYGFMLALAREFTPENVLTSAAFSYNPELAYGYFYPKNQPDQEAYVTSCTLTVVEASEVAVDIDVKPGSEPNCFNINGHGVVPVAILGSAELDVSQVDPNTLSFAGRSVRIRGNKGPLCSTEDSNGDPYLDLVCKFEDDTSQWLLGTDNEAELTGKLLDGTVIKGTDDICVVP